ncbi:MAG: AAA family ATPase, partial [Henriciella sp.]|nr:AAA family ATPase [Henriciella sp.]
MRFRALHLTRFGCFTNESIDFGGVSDAPDFHIVYGDNEAGKSTLRDAITSFLYGIPARTEYDFIHDY